MTAFSSHAAVRARRMAALRCATYGSGAPLLLVHDLASDGSVFQPLLPALAAQYHVIVPDLRGHGQSERLPGPRHVDQLVADLENVLDLLGLSSCHLLGHGAGGALAQQFAHAHPSRVRSLILACSWARRVGSLRAQIGNRLPFGRARHAEQLCSGNAAHVAAALDHFDSRPWLRTLACPTLVVAGGRDTIASPRRAAELLESLPAAQLHVFSDADHWPMRTHTDALLGVVLPWLAQQERAA